MHPKNIWTALQFSLANLPTQITKQSRSESWMKIWKNVTVSSTLPWSSFHLPGEGTSLNHESTMSLGSEQGRLLPHHDLMIWLIQVKVHVSLSLLFLFFGSSGLHHCPYYFGKGIELYVF